MVSLLGSILMMESVLAQVQEANDTSLIPIPEIVITAQRNKTSNINRPESISKMDRTNPHLATSQSTPDALSTVPGVWMQKTNLGGGSPFLRGLTGYHTLILIDGIRFNNATFRSGPNQYLNTIDPFLLENIEVMRGQGSVPYGSDALGGVIQLLSGSPEFTESGKDFKASLYGKYMGKGMEKTSRIEIETSFPRTAISGGATLKKLGDVVPGKGLDVLSPTGYSERSADVKIRHRIGANHLLTGSVQYLKQEEVPLYHKIVSGAYSKYHFDPQQHLLSYLRLESNNDSRLLSRITYTVSYQNSLEGRLKQKSNSSVTAYEKDRVSTMNGSMEVLSRPSSSWSITSGIEFYRDFVNSKTVLKDYSTGQSTTIRGLYPDRSSADNLALFSLHSLDLDRFTFVFGGRYNVVRLSLTDDLSGDTKISPSALIGNAGLNYKISPRVRLVTSISSGFRAPNLNDVSSLGIADFRYEIPNYDLKPERSLNSELGLKIHTIRFSGNFFLFRNKLRDLIANVKSSYNGSDSIDGYQVYERVNLNEALIQGFEAEGRLHLFPSLNLLGNISFTHGQDLQSGTPLRRIPPLNSRLGVWVRKNHFTAQLEWIHAREQSRLSPGDVDDSRIQDGGTPAWSTLDFSLGYSGRFYSLNTGVQNIFNKAYRYHGSGIDARGRSFWISLKVFANWKTKG